MLGVINWHPSPAALIAVGGDLFIRTCPTRVAAAPSERIVNSSTTRAPVQAIAAPEKAIAWRRMFASAAVPVVPNFTAHVLVFATSVVVEKSMVQRHDSPIWKAPTGTSITESVRST